MSETLLLSYRLDGKLTSRDGSHALQGVPGPIVAGPGDTILGPHPKAMRFGGTSHLFTPLAGGVVPPRAWTLRMLVQPTAGTGRELLCRCETVPFALTLTAGDVPERRGLMAIVTAQAHGGQGINSVRSANVTVNAGTWYLLDLVYDHDTLGLFVNQQLVVPFGLADGRLAAAPSGRLLLGGEADGAARFRGAVAGVQVLAGAPAVLSRRLEAGRSAPHWYLSRKYTEIDGRTLLGQATSGLAWDPVAKANRMNFQKGFIMHDARLGAFAVDGTLARGYDNLAETMRQTLGPLTSDAVTVERPACRYALFAGGGLYQSGLGTVPVTGRIHQHYLSHGGPTGFAGVPRAGSGPVTGGRQHPFQNVRFFEHTATQQVLGLRGPIAEEFNRLGGLARCGFPQSEVMPVYRRPPTAVDGEPGDPVGSRCNFQNCAIFQLGNARPVAVWKDSLRVHAEHGGVEGDLGFPTGDVVREGTGLLSLEYQTFERGSLVRLGTHPGKVFVCPAFQIYLERLETRESEGLQGENDLYFHLSIEKARFGADGEMLYERRFPPSGDFDDANTVHLTTTLPPTLATNDASAVYRLRADVWDADGLGGFDDDHLGDVRYELSVYNAWGQAVDGGVITVIDRKATLFFSVKPRFNRANYSFTDWHFFPFKNPSTPEISWRSYAAAFSDDVDEYLDFDDVLFDPLGRLWQGLFYQGAKRVGSKGNCWGFAVEAQNAWNGTSVFSPPLKRYSWQERMEREINIKHVSQVGRDRLDWHVNQLSSGRTQDPVRVFNDSRAAATGGGFPLLVLSHDVNIVPMTYLHAVLPYRWDNTVNPWVIECYDSNLPTRPNFVRVYPDEQKWEMNTERGAEPKVVRGYKNAGSRLWFIPWSKVNNIPAPLPSLSFLAGALLEAGFALLWDMLTNDEVTDLAGANLDLTRATAADGLRRPYMITPIPLDVPNATTQLWVRRAYTGSVNYAQVLRLAQGVGAARPWRYAMAFGHGELYFSGGGSAGDRLRVRMERVGNNQSSCTVSGSRAGTFTAAYTARTDEGGGQVKMILQGLPLGETPVQFSWEPGMEGFEVIAPGGGTATLTVTYARNGTQGSKRYRLPLGGSRVRISNVVQGGELLVYPISALNGVAWGQQVLAPAA
jgi:hypothetical protein